MLPGGAWGKRKPRGRRLGWVRSDARGTMWARQEGLHHPHPHTVVRCPSSSSSSVSCSGKGPPGCPCSLGPLLRGRCPFFLLSFPTATPTGCQSPEQLGSHLPVPVSLLWGQNRPKPGPYTLPDLSLFLSLSLSLSLSLCLILGLSPALCPRAASTRVCIAQLNFFPLGLSALVVMKT